jgi:hypothetical protein
MNLAGRLRYDLSTGVFKTYVPPSDPRATPYGVFVFLEYADSASAVYKTIAGHWPG